MKMIIKGGVMVFAAFLLVICIMDSGTSVIRKNVILEYNSNSDIVVKIISIDTRNGMVDLEVDQTFTHANGFTETTSERRTVILEDYVDKD